MNIAIDISPLTTGHFLQHRVRGTGFYLTNLQQSLLKYCPKDEFVFIKRGAKIPESIELLHIPYFEPFFITLPLGKKIPTVVTVHDLTPLVFPDKFPSGLKGNIKWQIQKNSLKNCDFIITDSYSSKKDIHKFTGIPADKIEVVYLAAADHFKVIKDREKLQKVKKKFDLLDKFLLYVGDATWNKNLPNLIKAVSQTDHNLVIAGSAFVNKDFDRLNPWNKDLHEAQVLAEANKRIKALGFVEDSDLVSLYNSATAFIMPSFYEGFGLPVLEAMASGCPVITSRLGSLEEVADNAAYFVDPYSTDSIKGGIEKVMKDEALRKALSQKGLAQSHKFSWKKCAKETNEIYRKVVLE
jgi:glycosyltransferase involved in cell wall biosynthesis